MVDTFEVVENFDPFQDHTDICKESTRTIMIITLSLNGVDCHGCPCDICLGLTAFDVLKDGGNREQ